MSTERGKRTVRTGVTGREMADEFSEQVLSTFGSVKATDEQHERLSDALVTFAVRWVNDEFEIGLRDA